MSISYAQANSDTAHGVRVDWVVARNRENASAVGHDEVLAFANDPEPGLLEGSHRL